METRQDLRFGQVGATGDGRGTVRIRLSDGARIVRGDLVALGGDWGPAQFQVIGEPYARFTVALPGRLKLDRNTVVRGFVSDPEGSGSLDGSGRATVWVGAKLVVKPGGTAGRHVGRFEVDVEYQ